MFMRALLLAAALGSMSGCATKIENPTDYITYRNEPLVRQVEEGMTRSRSRPSAVVRPPSSSAASTPVPATITSSTTRGNSRRITSASAPLAVSSTAAS